MGRFSLAFVAVGVAAALLVSCSSSAKVDLNKVLTKAEYIKESDAICNTFTNRINGVVGSAGSDISLATAKAILTQRLIPLFQEEHKELLRLRPPKADAARLVGALRAMSSGINTIIGGVKSAKSKGELDALNPRDIQAWKAEVGNYGMHVCGSKPTTTTTTTSQ